MFLINKLGLCAVSVWLLWIDFDAIIWIGLRNGLRFKTLKQAVFHTAALVFSPSWALAVGLFAILVMQLSHSEVWSLLDVGCVALVALSARVGRSSRKDLQERFRSLAAGD